MWQERVYPAILSLMLAVQSGAYQRFEYMVGAGSPRDLLIWFSQLLCQLRLFLILC
ncbi:hypothetical protein PSMA106859_12700 [Pseudoalteromonas maricaloris]